MISSTAVLEKTRFESASSFRVIKKKKNLLYRSAGENTFEITSSFKVIHFCVFILIYSTVHVEKTRFETASSFKAIHFCVLILSYSTVVVEKTRFEIASSFTVIHFCVFILIYSTAVVEKTHFETASSFKAIHFCRSAAKVSARIEPRFEKLDCWRITHR